MCIRPSSCQKMLLLKDDMCCITCGTLFCCLFVVRTKHKVGVSEDVWGGGLYNPASCLVNESPKMLRKSM